MRIVKCALAVYSWGIVGILIFFLWRIAYFYEKTSGQRVAYYLLLLPILLLTTGVGWYLIHNVDFIERPIGDLLLFSGGASLFMFGNYLQALMTGKRQ